MIETGSWQDDIPKLIAQWDAWQTDDFWAYDADYPGWMERAVACLREMNAIIEAGQAIQVLRGR